MGRLNGIQESRMDIFIKRFGKHLFEYDSVKKDFSKLDPRTRVTRSYALPDFFLFLGQNPDEVIAGCRDDILHNSLDHLENYEDKLDLYERDLEKTGYAPNSRRNKVGSIAGFFSNNSKRYSLDIRAILDRIPKVNLEEKLPFPLEDIRKVYNHHTKTQSKLNYIRNKCILDFAFQCGADPVDICKMSIEDLPSLPIKAWTVITLKVRSKTLINWYLVITPDLANDLNEYLRLRKTASGPLFGAFHGPLELGKFRPFTPQQIGKTLSKMIEFSGINRKSSGKDFRDAFDDVIRSSGVDFEVKEALMGHNVGIAAQYGAGAVLRDLMLKAMFKIYPRLALNEEYIKHIPVQETNARDTRIAELEKIIAELRKSKEIR